MPIPVAVSIELSEEERAQLESWARRHRSAQALAQRSRIVLAAAQGLKNTEISGRLGVNRSSVTKWRSRFSERRLDGLLDELDGPGGRPHAVGGAADLARVRPSAPPQRNLEALQGPAVRGQGPRCRRALPEPAGASCRAVCG